MKLKEHWQDRRWLARLNRGEGSVFAEIYDVLAPRVLRHVRLRVMTLEVAEDIAAETFLKAWAQVAGERVKIRSVKAFIFKIANNLIIDHYRARGREEPTDLEVFAAMPDEEISAQKISLAIDSKRLEVALEELLTHLPDQYRQVIIWRYVDDFSIAEIAELAGKSKDAVYVLLHRALQALKKKLDYETF